MVCKIRFARLSKLSEQQIKAFEDILSEKLFLLDGEMYAKHIGDHGYRDADAAFSVDGFLYARCMAVARGKSTYEKILEKPSEMVKNEDFEPLLDLAGLAYFQKTGKELDHIPAFIYETFANSKGWKNENYLAKILT